MVDAKTAVENTVSDKSGKDITNEIEVDKDKVELFSIEELVPSSTPMTVAYLEIYRTNELEYVPYLSPYNTGVQSTDSSEDSSDSSSDENSENGDGTNSDGTNTDGTSTNSDGSNSNGAT